MVPLDVSYTVAFKGNLRSPEDELHCANNIIVHKLNENRIILSEDYVLLSEYYFSLNNLSTFNFATYRISVLINRHFELYSVIILATKLSDDTFISY